MIDTWKNKNVSHASLLMYIFAFTIIFQDSIQAITNMSIVSNFDEVLITLFVIRAILYMLRELGSNYRVLKMPKIAGKLLILVGLFWSIGIISCLVNSSYKWFDLLMGSFLMIKIYLLISSIIISPIKNERFEEFVHAVLFWGKVSFISGLLSFFFPTAWVKLVPYTFVYMKNGFSSAMGFFIHPGQYGWFMLFVANIYYARYICNGKDKKDLYRFIAYACVACLSMKVKVFVGIIVILAFSNFFLQNKKVSIKNISMAFLGIFLVFGIFRGIIQNAYSMYFTDDTGSARYALLAGSLKILADLFPIGAGFSKFGSYYARINYSEWYYKYGLNTVWGLQPGQVWFGTDTFWPMIIGETGLIGLVIYILILLLLFVDLRRLWKKVEDNRVRVFLCMGLFALLQAIAESSGEPIFNSSPQNVIVGLFIGYAIASAIYLKTCGAS